MIPYGKMFYSGQVILVHLQEAPAFFARVEQVEADVKKGWWRMTFTILTVPTEVQSWLLDDDQMRGQAFTMNQIPVRIEQVPPPDFKQQPVKDNEQDVSRDGESNVVSLFGDD